MQHPTNQTYAEISNQIVFPKREQAIVIPSIEDTKIEEYIYAVGNVVQPRNILAASRISHNRVCIYLSSAEVVADFITQHPDIVVNSHRLKVRKLISPAKRIVISNVSPHIPHAVIENELLKLNLKLMSPMTFIKYNVTNEEYNHVCSFRRQIFCIPHESETNLALPESIVIEFENESSRIFLSDDTIYCSICKKHDHPTSKCKEKTKESQPVHRPTSQHTKNTSKREPKETIDKSMFEHTTIISPVLNPVSNNTNNTVTSANTATSPAFVEKIIEKPSSTLSISNALNDSDPPLSSTTSISTSVTPPLSRTNTDEAITKTLKRDLSASPTTGNKESNFENKIKKFKPDESDISNLKILLKPLSKVVENQSKILLGAYSLDQLAQIVSASKQCENSDAISRSVNIPISNTDILIAQLRLIHENTKEKGLKTRVTRLINKIKPQNEEKDDITVES